MTMSFKTFVEALKEDLEVLGEDGILRMQRGELSHDQKVALARLIVLARRLVAALSTL
jgi:hypothetical protein